MCLLLSKMNIKHMSIMVTLHIMITFWAFPYGLDNKIVIQSGVRCVQNMPKFWAHYGHIHAMGTYFEHLAGIVQTTVKSLDTFWA